MEYLMSLDYDEVLLLKSINYYFENEHRFWNGQKEDLLFDLVDQVLGKVADETLDLDLDDYYFGELENEMDHANLTQMRHLLRDAGAHLYKKMYDPNHARRERRRKQMDAAISEDLKCLGAHEES
jgi:hypothetical protein